MATKKLIYIEDATIMIEAFKQGAEANAKPFNKFEWTFVQNRAEFAKVKHIEYDICISDWRVYEPIPRLMQDVCIPGSYYLNQVKARTKYILTTHNKDSELMRYIASTNTWLIEKEKFSVDDLNTIYDEKEIK